MVSDDRGQAYTLEGFMGAIVLLMAVLIAVQSIVVSPSAGGDVDRSVQAQLQGEARDALVVAESEGDLSHVVRYWGPDEGEYHNSNADDRRGSYTPDGFADRSNMSATAADEFGFGELLDKRFGEAARSYNVELVHQNRTEAGEVVTESFYLVFQGSPDSGGVSASHTITLTDSQELTTPETTKTLREAGNESNSSYWIPNIDEERQVYNVVEVRLVVW